MHRLLILGGDMRSIYLADLLMNKNCDVTLCGFDTDITADKGIPQSDDVCDALAKADVIILPIPVTKDSQNLYTPLYSSDIALSHVLEATTQNTLVLGGAWKGEMFSHRNIKYVDYSFEADFELANAMLTAEGTLSAVMQKLERSISGIRCVVTGYGRCAKAVAGILKAMDAHVTVCARNPYQLEMAAQSGYNVAPLKEMHHILKDKELIINTIPAPIICEKEFTAMKKDVLIADVSSLPGGVCESVRSALGTRYLFLPGLPGKYAPLGAAQAIADAVLKIIADCRGEDFLWT